MIWYNQPDPKSAGIPGFDQEIFNYCVFLVNFAFRTLGFLDPDEIGVLHTAEIKLIDSIATK